MYDARALPRVYTAILVAVALVACVVALGGCYDPRIRACTVTCSTAAECGSGQTCENGFCQKPGDSCAPNDAPDPDAPDVDAMPGDADDTDAPDGGSNGTWEKLAVGGYHACGITSARVLYCWGNNDYQQLGRSSPTRSGTPLRVDAGGSATNDWTEITAGTRHSCGIRNDGSLWCWGFNEGRQCGAPSNTFVAPTRVSDPSGQGTRWTAVTAGVTFTCALRDNGTLWCFGTGDAGQIGQNTANTTSATPLRVGTGTDWRAIDAGYTHICGIYGPTGQRWHAACWGNDAGQDRIGDDGNMNRHVPTDVDDNDAIDWRSVSAGDYSACGLDEMGRLFCWGDQFHVPLGAPSPTPTQYGTFTGIDGVSVGSFGGCLVENGVTKCWGYNLEGELGFQPSNGTGTPEPIAGLTSVVDVGAGATFVCARESTGVLACWGDRADGQLGDGVVGDPRQPAEVLGAHHPWASVDVADEHTCGVTVAGAIYCWGSNWGGQIGGGAAMSAPFYEAPIPVMVSGTWDRVHGGFAHGCARDGSNMLTCWGNNDYGQRGAIAPTNYDPVSVDATPLASLAVARHSNCGVTATGARRCWGRNNVYQLGNNDNSDVSAPATISEGGLTNWSKLSMGDEHGCGLSNGTLHCWGYNNVGQAGQPVTTSMVMTPMPLGDPTPGTTDSWIDVAAGAGHGCSLISTNGTSGTIWCWGYNGRGQLGTVRADGPMLTSVPSASNFIDVASGYGHTCGVRATGELHCWGSNDNGELGDGTLVPHTSIGTMIGGVTDWVAADAGTYVTCGIRGADRRLFCWGDNRYGQTGTGGALRYTIAAVPVP